MGSEVPGEQLLIGRRFMDQLRAPARARGRAASIMAGPRGKTSEEEEATATNKILSRSRVFVRSGTSRGSSCGWSRLQHDSG